MTTSMDYSAAHSLLAAHGQQHVLRYFDQLDPAQQQRLLAQIATLDLQWVKRVFAAEPEAVTAGDIAPCDDVVRPGDPRDDEARELGLQALAAGGIAALVVAGGQGSRLGFDGPKGAFPIGAVSGHTLFQIHAERLLAAGRRHGVVPPLYLMTSEANHDDTCALFEQHQNFGLPADRLLIFPQGMAPAVDEQCQLLLDAPGHLVTAANGNGGTFAALRDGGVFEHMDQNGVDLLSYIHVDNPLAPTCDALFVGHHLLRHSDYSCKAIPKTGPAEKVGSFALVDGKLRIVEYTELPERLAQATDEQGELLFGMSNPGLYIWGKDFARAQAHRTDLPFHRAHKKIPHLDAAGELVRPAAPCGYKFEAFAMDTLADARRTMLLLLPDRDSEFAPIKNATGVDSPDSSRQLMTQLYAGWVRAAGGQVSADLAALEISPLYAADAQELARRMPAGFVAQGEQFLDQDS